MVKVVPLVSGHPSFAVAGVVLTALLLVVVVETPVLDTGASTPASKMAVST